MKALKGWDNIGLILKIYGLAILFFFVFRLMLFFTGIGNIDDVSDSYADIVKAFIMGIRFDIVISGYLLVFPYLALTILFLLNKRSLIISRIVFYFVFILFSVSFLICAIDIPYFNQFFSRFTISAFQWLDSPVFVFRMVIEEPRYWVYTIPFFLLTILFYMVLRIIFRKSGELPVVRRLLLLKIVVSVIFLGFMFAGIRGRLAQKAPIKVGTAYVTDNAFLNQLGLNPVFTLMQSYLENLDKRNEAIRLIDEKVAITKVQQYLGISSANPYYPLYRQVIPDSVASNKPNVVIIIMESMAASKMKRNGNTQDLTPFLDSLALNSYYFDSIYTAGIHTFNGIFSTLFSYPAIFRQQPMRESRILRYNGISNTLKKLGYSTTYITTHDGQFDNVEGFLSTNDFDQIITEADYPSDEVKTTLGVPDDYMFRYSIPVMNKLHEKGKPFLVSFMTASNHGPYYLPEYFSPRNTDLKDQIIEYSDWALQQFMKQAAKQKWYSNTLFVFVADHGIHKKRSYDISLEYHHTPLIFFAPALLPGNRIFNCIGGQIDIYPTIMGILHQPWINNTSGIDLLREERPYIMVNSIDNYGVIGKEFFLIVKHDGRSKLFRYRNGSLKDYSLQFPEIRQQMDEYARCNLQVFQYINDNGRQFVK
ncbi:MAG: sulfatase-like hydrolase/transferase [Bacteroidales bacterium]|nr:sulfatase-like hydrolase/transferase [Bacteroidales bacterium]